jgi:hypothetical protein
MPVKEPQKFSEYMAIFPPAVCRLLARSENSRGQSVRPLTDREIADRSGLGLDEVRALAWAKSWNNVPAPTMVAFSKACGLDFDDRQTMRKHLRWLKRMAGRWEIAGHYLRRDPEWETKWQPLIQNFFYGK